MKDIKQLNQALNFEFLRLDIKGTNIESFYSYRFELFLFETSELSPKEKIEAIITGQLNGKSEITINKVLSERTFIQDQIIRTEANLKEPIRPETREKLLIWIDYLKQREKAIAIIKVKVPEWSVPLMALYYVYHDIKITDNNKKEKVENLGYTKTASDLKDQYYFYKDVQNRTYKGLGIEEKPKANAQLNRLLDLKLIMEDRGKKDTPPYNWLLSDIEELKKELGRK
ncbi:MAG: hypothetical protein WC389_11580 [Lutibacter sp.]|jgi:hypothetical protein